MSIVTGAIETTLRVAIGWQPMGYRLVACAPRIAFILVEIRLPGLECADMSALSKRSRSRGMPHSKIGRREDEFEL
jgi:hypothetical protein